MHTAKPTARKSEGHLHIISQKETITPQKENLLWYSLWLIAVLES